MQGKHPSRRSAILLWSMVRQATNQEVCRRKTEARAMAQLMQKDCKPGRIWKCQEGRDQTTVVMKMAEHRLCDP